MRRFENILRGGLYRSRNGIILGVCRGFAEYFDFSVFWARVITLALLFLTGFWPILIIYFVAALLMKPEPVIPIESDEEQEFYDSYVHSHKGATERLKRRYENLERRIRRMEDHVTTREFDWENKLKT
ncbi:MAG: envelope stress response membrane protein PspC [Deltaproteobacteria bacterium]|jgi:phage shock protein C|nr:MAG: envelope stress response membrane protein PspC [Deltaproteobacteria bacterium]